MAPEGRVSPRPDNSAIARRVWSVEVTLGYLATIQPPLPPTVDQVIAMASKLDAYVRGE